MTTKTIFDLVMPDLPERRIKLESIITRQSNPEFAAQVCAEFSPIFYFFIQKSWELLDDPLMMTEVESWFKVANKCSLDLIKMGSWLLLQLEYCNEEDKHKQIERLLARHLISTDYHKPKFRNRMLQIIDSTGEKVWALTLVKGTPTSLIMEEPNNEYGETYVNDEVTYLDKNGKLKLKSNANVESQDYEQGIPRTTWKNVRTLSQRLLALKAKEKAGGLSDEERKERSCIQSLVFKGKPRFNYPRSDNAAANIRRGLNYFSKKLDEEIVFPRSFGSNVVKEGFSSGRACSWEGGGIYWNKLNTKKGIAAFNAALRKRLKPDPESGPYRREWIPFRRDYVLHDLLAELCSLERVFYLAIYTAGRDKDTQWDFGGLFEWAKQEWHRRRVAAYKHRGRFSYHTGSTILDVEYIETGLKRFNIITP